MTHLVIFYEHQGDQNGSIKIWDLGSAKCISDIIPDAQTTSTSAQGRVAIQSVDVSNDGRTLVAANNHAEVFAWNPSDALKNQNDDSCQPVAKFRAHALGAYLLHARISPDCRHLVTTSSDKTARLWDTTTWKLTQTLSQHNKWVWDAVFSADSSYLVTASSDRTARLWNLRTGTPVRQYVDHDYGAFFVCFFRKIIVVFSSKLKYSNRALLCSAVTCVALNDSST
jgi:G protein beta subunit-like protein